MAQQRGRAANRTPEALVARHGPCTRSCKREPKRAAGLALDAYSANVLDDKRRRLVDVAVADGDSAGVLELEQEHEVSLNHLSSRARKRPRAQLGHG